MKQLANVLVHSTVLRGVSFAWSESLFENKTWRMYPHTRNTHTDHWQRPGGWARPTREGARILGWLVPGIPYPGLVPQVDGPPLLHARHPACDVRPYVWLPCCQFKILNLVIHNTNAD